jgi:type VI secretion system protein ImpH
MPARVEEFRGGWMKLPVHSRLRLGESEETGVLGQSTVIGQAVWGCQQRFRIVLGPLGLTDFKRMLPNQNSIRRLAAVVRNYLGDEKDWDVQLILKQSEVPDARLGHETGLGLTSWLSHPTRERDADDVVLAPAPGHG